MVISCWVRQCYQRVWDARIWEYASMLHAFAPGDTGEPGWENTHSHSVVNMILMLRLAIHVFFLDILLNAAIYFCVSLQYHWACQHEWRPCCPGDSNDMWPMTGHSPSHSIQVFSPFQHSNLISPTHEALFLWTNLDHELSAIYQM